MYCLMALRYTVEIVLIKMNRLKRNEVITKKIQFKKALPACGAEVQLLSKRT